MKKTCIAIVISLVCIVFSGQAAISCSDFLLNNSGDFVVSARTMDFRIPLQAEVVVVPRNESFRSSISDTEKFMSWKSKYGFVGTNAMQQYAFTDGLNEKGLSVGMLWLGVTKFPDIKNVPAEKVMQIGNIAHWILGSFATAEEVKEGVKNVVVAGAPVRQLNDKILPLHIAVHDANKKSLVIEFTEGKMQVYDNPYMVMTNDPPFPGQIENLKNYLKMDGRKVKDPALLTGGDCREIDELPGDSSPKSRFIRIFVLNKVARISKTAREAVNSANHIMNRITLVDDEIDGETTEYGIIRDHKNLVYYVVDNQNANLRAIDLKKIDFGEKAPKLKMPVAGDGWFVPANDELKPY